MDIPGPLGDSAVEIAESIPSISVLNGVNTTRILESGKSVIDSLLLPRLPEWTTGEPLLDRVLNAMWLYLMSYRLADEEKIDETSIWYVVQFVRALFVTLFCYALAKLKDTYLLDVPKKNDFIESYIC